MRSFTAVAFAAGLLLTPALVITAWAPTALAQGKPQYGSFGLDLSAMDRSVKPGDDFFQYVNGGWLKTAVIPPDRSSAGSFQDLQILSETRMSVLVAELDAKPEAQL